MNFEYFLPCLIIRGSKDYFFLEKEDKETVYFWKTE